MSATTTAAPALVKTPLFLIAGCHASLHWGLATFYVLLPFIQQELALNYTQTGLLASVVHIASFAVNLPSGALVDVSGKRLLCQLVSLFLAGAALAGFGLAGEFWMVVLMTAVLAGMNTMWHPAAISFLSSNYREQRGLALSFHTVGASIGDALAPIAVGSCVAILGWQTAGLVGAGPPLIAGLLLWFYFAGAKDADAEDASARPKANAQRRSFSEYLDGMGTVLRDARVWAVCLLAGLRGTCQVGLRAFVPLYIVNEMGASAVWIGVVLLAFQGTGALTTPSAGAVSDRMGRRTVLLAGLLIGGAVVIGMPAITSPLMFAAIAAVAGASLLSMRPVIQGWALDLTPPHLGGSTISMVFAIQALFAAAVPVVSGLAADEWGIAAAFYLFGGAAFAAAGVAFLVSEPQQ